MYVCMYLCMYVEYRELRMAINHYFTEYKKSLLDIVRSKASYKNYRDFVLKILDVCTVHIYLSMYVCMYVCMLTKVNILFLN